MKHISNNTQGGSLYARIVGSGEYGILLADEEKKTTKSPIYWDSREDAITDLKRVIGFFSEPKQ